jgi:hypothetical protein
MAWVPEAVFLARLSKSSLEASMESDEAMHENE